MAIETTQVTVRPEQGWVMAAEAPAAFCIIKPNMTNRWFYAISVDAPDDLTIGIPMGVDKFQPNEVNIQAVDMSDVNVYVRVAEAQSHYLPYDPNDETQGASTFNIIAG